MIIKKEYFFEVILWWACNLDCTYCYQKDSPLYSSKKTELLKTAITSKENLSKIIELIKNYSWKNTTIWVIIYWWEPFVHKENLIFFIEKFFNFDIPNITDLSILSNWTIIDHDIFSIANKYWCYIDCCGHIKNELDIYTDYIFWKSHSDFLEEVKNNYTNINLISHLVISDKFLKYLDLFFIYYNSRLNWHRLIIWFDYVDSDWEDKNNLRYLYKFLLNYKINYKNYNFKIKFEPLVCKAWTFTTRHQSSWGVHILPNWDIFGCWYPSVAKNITKEKYDQLKISNIHDNYLFYNIDLFLDKLEKTNKILCERDEYGPYFPCYLKRNWIKKIWHFVNKYMNEFI